MTASKLSKSTLIMLYGLPGAGKAVFAKELAHLLGIAHVCGDEIRSVLFDQPDYTRSQEAVVGSVAGLMIKNFLSAGTSVVVDVGAARWSDRKQLRDLARAYKAESVLIWLQIDAETALMNAKARQHHTKHKLPVFTMNESAFAEAGGSMQNPYLNETYMVVSGKHLFATQKKVVLRKLHDLQLLADGDLQPKIPMPGLVNLVSQAADQRTAGRVDFARRNINIK